MRIFNYIQTMFPLQVYVPGTIGSFYAVYFGAQIISGASSLTLSMASVIGAISWLLFTFLMRLYDEIKDAESDIRLAKEGDQRYINRPIVTGAITLQEIEKVKLIVQWGLVLINIGLGWPWPGVAFLVVHGFMWLSSRWFFYPKIKDNLLLAFVTHNPVVFLYALYALAVFKGDFSTLDLNLSHYLLAFCLWMPMAAWEISRKIRLPEMETNYQTYSMMLGWRNAAGVALLFASLCVFGLAYLAWVAQLHPAFMTALFGIWSWYLCKCMALIIWPTAQRTQLQPETEKLVFVVNWGLIVGAIYALI